jgi:urease accessory protein
MMSQHFLFTGGTLSRSTPERGARRNGALDAVKRRPRLFRGLPLVVATLLVVLLPSEGRAHHAEWMRGQPFIQGLSMPIHGVDHMLVAVGVGLVAVQLGGSALWRVPSLFGLLMWIGGLLNVNGVAVPLLEQTILASILVLGAILARRQPVSLLVSSIAVSVFAAIQGNALLENTPAPSVNWSLAHFSAGCVMSALAVLASGMGLGLLLQRLRHGKAVRYAGTAIIAAGIVVYLFPSANEVVIRLLE